MIDTRTQWISELEHLSSFVRSYNLNTTLKDFSYVERPSGKPSVVHDGDAFGVANSPPHNAIIAEAIKALQGRMPDAAIRSLIGELTFRKTYGAFSELVAYKWFGDAGVDFTAQVPMTSAQVVNPNGSIIDGRVTLANGKVACFDIKGFGFVAHKIKILQNRLEEKLPGKTVLVEGAWNVSIDALQDLLDYNGFSALVSDLQKSPVVKRDPLEFRVQNKQRVTISVHEMTPLELAQENREYPLRFASQYARQEPFLLVFIIHPWFSQGELHQNAGSFVDRFTKELSKLAFVSFQSDTTLVEGVPCADATKLLSSLVFLNGWPATGTDAPQPRPFCRVYLNSHATHALARSDFASFEAAFANGIAIEVI
jgi:hypothetical protein